jgi:hypothetical protein
MNNLYKLSIEFEELTMMLENEEIDQQTFDDTIEGLGVNDKIENIIRWHKNLLGEETMLKAEAKRLTDRAKTASNRAIMLKGLLLNFMTISGHKKYNVGLFKVTRSDGRESLDIHYEDSIPAGFYDPVPSKLDKKKLLSAVKGGTVIAGVETKRTPSVSIK